MKLTTGEVDIREKRQLSRNIQEKKHWSASLWKRPDRQNTGSSTSASPDPSTAEMRMIWMPKTHQSQNSQSSGHKPYFQIISFYNWELSFLIFLSILQQKKCNWELLYFSFISPSFCNICLSHSSLMWHWHIKQKGQEKLCHLT